MNEYRQAIASLTSGAAEPVRTVVRLDDGSEEKRDLAVHPLARMIPLISPGDLDRLTDDIAVNGVNEPLDMYQGKVLDGRNRLAIASVTGTPVRLRDFEGDEAAAKTYVWSANVARRQLSLPQLALAADRFGFVAKAKARPGGGRPVRAGGVTQWARDVSRQLGGAVTARTLERFDDAKIPEAPETMAGIESGSIRRIDVAVKAAAAERSLAEGRDIAVPPPVPRTPWDRLGCARGDVQAAERAILDGETGTMTREQFKLRAREIQGVLIRIDQLYIDQLYPGRGSKLGHLGTVDTGTALREESRWLLSALSPSRRVPAAMTPSPRSAWSAGSSASSAQTRPHRLSPRFRRRDTGCRPRARRSTCGGPRGRATTRTPATRG